MLTRVVLASATRIPDELLALVPGDPTLTHELWGQRATTTVEVSDPDALRTALREAAGDVSVAVITGALATHSAQLVLFDVDSTLTTTEAVDLLAEHAGKGPEVAAVTERAMRGELDFAASLRERVATLAGLSTDVFLDVAPRMHLSPGAHNVITLLHSRGVRLGVTSGGFIQLVRPLADRLGLDFANANELEVTDAHLTGRVVGDIVDGQQKARDLARMVEEFGVDPELTIAVGDGANDLAMMEAAGLGIAYCAKPVTAQKADVGVGFPRLDAVAAFALVD